MSYRVLIVEDDPAIARYMKQFLASWEYEVETVEDFHAVLNDFLQFQPDLVLMDVSLPVLNGFEWTRRIRQISEVPIVFVSSAKEEMNLVMALSMGADDYILKPFESSVLAAKIQAILRRAYDFNVCSSWMEHKGLRFSLDACCVEYEQKKVELSKNEGKILRLLMERKGQIVPRDALMEALWQTDCFVDENTLSVNVNRLRKKLDQAGAENFIQTRKGIGYQI